MQFVKDWEYNGTVMVRCSMKDTVLLYGISDKDILKWADLETNLSLNFVVVRCPIDIIALPAFLSIIELSGISKDAMNECISLINLLETLHVVACSYVILKINPALPITF